MTNLSYMLIMIPSNNFLCLIRFLDMIFFERQSWNVRGMIDVPILGQVDMDWVRLFGLDYNTMLS